MTIVKFKKIKVGIWKLSLRIAFRGSKREKVNNLFHQSLLLFLCRQKRKKKSFLGDTKDLHCKTKQGYTIFVNYSKRCLSKFSAWVNVLTFVKCQQIHIWKIFLTDVYTWNLIVVVDYPPASEASREVANLTWRKNPHTPKYGVKEFVCL